MVSLSYHDFFAAAAAAAGALIGLLFVAMSVWQGRDTERVRVEAHRLRAVAALAVFSDALVISLFAVIPHVNLGQPTTIVGGLGIATVLASSLRLIRLRREGVVIAAREAVFVGIAGALFVAQFAVGFSLWGHPGRAHLVTDAADLVVGCFVYGIGRSWELIGGPQLALMREVGALMRVPHDASPPEEPRTDQSSA